MVIFLAYEGFELIANTASDANPEKLPLAYYTAVCFVMAIYVLVAIVTIGNLPLDEIIAARDYALAESAKPFLGNAGFVLVAIAALLSTSSAINATLYGAARVSYTIAKYGELPKIFERKVWRAWDGLLLTGMAAIMVANVLDLSSISTAGSAGFLLIFAAVNAANAKLHARTESRRWISVVGALMCLTALCILLWQSGAGTFLLMVVASFASEFVYRKITGREIRPIYGDGQR
jgi:amino acid transporter